MTQRFEFTPRYHRNRGAGGSLGGGPYESYRSHKSYPYFVSTRPKSIGRVRWTMSFLPRIQLNHELLVHDRGDFFARRNAHDLALELVLIHDQPIRYWLDLSQLKVSGH
jgi:hypothetical protein